MSEIQEKEIKFKKGMKIHSSKYGWTRVISKIKNVEEEIHLRNLDTTDERTYIFLIENTIKNIKSGIFEIINENGK